MERGIRANSADRVNYLNIALMLVACAAALFIPFPLFLFAYAVLGPAHYLTEISWLEKRRFFTRGKYDFLLLGALAVPLLFLVPSFSGNAGQIEPYRAATYTFLALGSGLVLAFIEKALPRIIALAAVAALAFLVVGSIGFAAMLFGLFVPTLVHVYVFTGFFMIYGALKERSRTGYLAFLVFLLCPVACWLVNPARIAPATSVAVSYWNSFSLLNIILLGSDPPQTNAEAASLWLKVFSSGAGLIVMRFIAFAYTYHYLNWFSKTSIIKWHDVGVPRMAAIAVAWIVSVGIYLYDYALGFKLLFFLSMLHVYLEFPLNHISIAGTFREIRSLAARPA